MLIFHSIYPYYCSYNFQNSGIVKILIQYFSIYDIYRFIGKTTRETITDFALKRLPSHRSVIFTFFNMVFNFCGQRGFFQSLYEIFPGNILVAHF